MVLCLESMQNLENLTNVLIWAGPSFKGKGKMDRWKFKACYHIANMESIFWGYIKSYRAGLSIPEALGKLNLGGPGPWLLSMQPCMHALKYTAHSYGVSKGVRPISRVWGPYQALHKSTIFSTSKQTHVCGLHTTQNLDKLHCYSYLTTN